MPTRRSVLSSLLLLAALAGLGPVLAPRGTAGQGSDRDPGYYPEPQHLIVLHTNDLHGQVVPLPATWLRDVDPIPQSGGLARIGAYIRQVRAEAEREGARVLVLDAGDWFQGTPEGSLDRGLGVVRAVATMGYDALCVGNHEFDHGVDHAEHLLEEVPLPALLANARQPSGAPLAGTQEYTIVELGGLNVAVVGLLSTGTPQMSHPSTRTLEWEDPAACLARIREELDEGIEEIGLVIPVTHLGVDGDRELARAHPDLPLIVGGHSHTFLPEGTREGDVRIVQAGSKARGIGRVDLYLDGVYSTVIPERTRVQVVNLLEDFPAEVRNDELERRCAELVERSAKLMDQVVGTFAAPLARGHDPLRTSPAGNLITDLMRARTGADVAIHNNGGTRADLPAGEATRRDLFRVLPFDNHLVTVRMTGAELEALVRRSVEGGARSGLTFSGMTVGVGRDGREARLLGILVGEHFLDPRATYDVTTNSFLASGGDAYAELVHGKDRREDPALLRELLEGALAEGPVTPPVENRYRVR